MKSILVWKDGRREETEWGGGISHHLHRRLDGRDMETVFHIDESLSKKRLVYVEGETTDVTDATARASRAYSLRIAEMHSEEREDLDRLAAVRDYVAKERSGEMSDAQAMKQIRRLLK